MNNVLVLSSSLNFEQGNSSQLAQQFIDKLQAQQTLHLTKRDLAKQPLDHLTIEEVQAWMTANEQKTPEQHNLSALSDNLIEEVQKADTLIIAMPMYNFGIPSTFKTWMDRVARAGVTFKYTDNGPVGLLTNKKVIIIAARGGAYQGTVKDSQSQHLSDFFALIGITDVEFIYAEGLNMGQQEQSFTQAAQQMDKMISALS